MSRLILLKQRRRYDPRFTPRFVVDIAQGGLADMVGGAPMTYTRAGLAWAFANGILRQYAANEPRIVTSPVGVPAFLQEAAIANKCTNYNANPDGALTNWTTAGDAAGILSEVADAAELAAIGVSAVCTNGKVFKLDNLAGVAVATMNAVGATGNTNVHTASAWIRGGTGAIGTNTGGAKTAFAASPGYVRRSHTFTPADNVRRLSIDVNPGQVIYVILNQLEEQSIATTPIVVAGATVTRNVDFLSYALVSGGDVSLFADYCFAASTDGVNSEAVAIMHDGTNNERIALYRLSGGTVNGLIVDGGVTQASQSSASVIAGGVRARSALRAALNDMKVCTSGVLSGGDAAATMPATTALQLGRAAVTASSVPRQAFIHGVRVYGALTDAQLQALTA